MFYHSSYNAIVYLIMVCLTNVSAVASGMNIMLHPQKVRQNVILCSVIYILSYRT